MKRKGICMVCGCTHEDPCDEGCGWANVKQTLCDACEPLTDKARERKRRLSLIDLAAQEGMVAEELAAVRERMKAVQERIAVLDSERKS
jgi:hypothetical protein